MSNAKEKQYISPLRDILDSWLEFRPVNTRKQYQRILRRWSSYLGCDIDQPESLDVWTKATHRSAQRYVAKLQNNSAQSGRSQEASPDGKISASTIRYTAVVLKAAYDQLVIAGATNNNVWMRLAQDLKRHNTGQRRPHKLMPLEVVQMFLSFPVVTVEDARDLACFHLLFGAALRRSEVVALRLSDVQYTQEGTCFLRLPKTKAGTIQLLPIAEWVAKPVEKIRQSRRSEGARDNDPLFVRYLALGRRPALCQQHVYRVFLRYLKHFGVKELYTPHCARVTAITRLLDQGVSHREVQELSRHSSVTMVERYDRKRLDINTSAATKLRYT